MAPWEEIVLVWPAPIVGLVVGIGLARAEGPASPLMRAKRFATGMMAGLMGWLATVAMILAGVSILFRVAVEVLWIVALLVMCAPGRG